MILYSNLADTLNKTKFQCAIPDSYEFPDNVPAYYRNNPHLRPIYKEDGSYSTTFISITQIILLTCDNIDFHIKRKEDVVLITSLIDAYIKEMYPFVKDMPDTNEHKIYLSRCITTRNTLNPEKDRAERNILGENKHKETNSLTKLLGIFSKFL